MDSTLWRDLFHPDVSILEKIIRPILVYLFLIFSLRLAGKRELAQLNPFDLVVLLTLSNTVQNAIIGNDNSVSGGIIGAATLLAVNFLVVWYLYGHQRLEHLIEGEPDLLVKDGKVRHKRLKHELITLAELQAAARRQGFPSLDNVDRAILEPGGTISFCAKTPPIEERRHGELLVRLDGLLNEIKSLATANAQRPQAT